MTGDFEVIIEKSATIYEEKADRLEALASVRPHQADKLQQKASEFRKLACVCRKILQTSSR